MDSEKQPDEVIESASRLNRELGNVKWWAIGTAVIWVAVFLLVIDYRHKQIAEATNEVRSQIVQDISELRRIVDSGASDGVR